MVMMGFNQDNSATDIRLDVNGVFKYHALNTLFGHFALVDINSYRQCLGYFRADEQETVKLSVQELTLFNLEGDHLDALFSNDEVPASIKPMPRPSPKPAYQDSVKVTNLKPKLQTGDQGTYNMILVLLKPGQIAEEMKVYLNQFFKEHKLPVRTVTWKEALGPVGSMTSLIKGALFVFVGLLFVVAVIIIINTLSMAALERTSEIGMMRAIGAHQRFISLMFLAETAALSAIFGGAGIVVGALVVALLPLFRITSDNDMMQLFFGGDVFYPLLSAIDLGLCILQLAIVTVVAVAYPLWLARSIKPLDAVYKE